MAGTQLPPVGTALYEHGQELADGLKSGLRDEAKAVLERVKEAQANTRDARTGRIKRARIHAEVLALRWQGFGPKETAQILGIGLHTVKNALSELRESADLDAQHQRLDQIAVPLAVDNVIEGVINRDKEYTRDLMQGRGLYRNHKSIEADIKQTNLTLNVNVELPDLEAARSAGVLPVPKEGQIVGAPAIPAVAVSVE